jgi:tRNA dimethylallyltransferase
VIVVGGTGLYFRALTLGLCEAPPTPDELRDDLDALSVPELRTRLERVDPGMLAELDDRNPRRLARAIAVMETTGRSLRDWRQTTPAVVLPAFRAFWLQRERAELRARIAARVDAMLAAG